MRHEEKTALTCGDGASIRDEADITLVADPLLRALLIDLSAQLFLQGDDDE